MLACLALAGDDDLWRRVYELYSGSNGGWKRACLP
jgi:hypothetical protein